MLRFYPFIWYGSSKKHIVKGNIRLKTSISCEQFIPNVIYEKCILIDKFMHQNER